ncbi:glycoside hydrolase family 3 C-terminal domain-containing protein [Paenibacillus polymyxa]|uniref:glycoside hydrolase family 3 C-terminal domain-containing protein n=1 Tax=Paenibacillus polymyxa TaxID=1406 RepID=UPI002AB581AE|nr:glycoside hydrolase family 3 C-terminal domain-containing protein [Paenibacillus polymyxa]MDY8023265.1 glycoside hydrolase family 3 C-terminal domain-containing protein [Paenibacillus polymyxa]
MHNKIDELIRELTLEEKASLCSGKDFWNTQDIKRLGIPSIMMTDGPHGVRKQEGNFDHLGLNKSVPSTCFPTAAGVACSWNEELIAEMGAAIGEECQAEDVSILLGPGANIKRSPLCGRNFEYYSEDPYLSGKMASSFIKGVQSQGVGTSLKHFAANNQEYRRMSINAVVDERTLREIYLASFEEAVIEAEPWTVMSAYNRLNGEFCAQNKILLTDILKEEWGFEGAVISDWGGAIERDADLEAGLEIEMPSSGGRGEAKIIEAVKSGWLPEEMLDQAVRRILKLVFKAAENKKAGVVYDPEKHHELARKAARESMVLLKNEDHMLPLKPGTTLAVIGGFAKQARYQGAGSSFIQTTKLDVIYDELKKLAGDNANLLYADGYAMNHDEIDEAMIHEAVKQAKQAEVAVIFAGLPARYESEGFDRKHLKLPANHQAVIEAVSKVQTNTIVVLSNGSPVEMPWLNQVKAVLEGYLGGQATGGAVADLLFGVVSPSGKLAETFPRKLAHNPSYLNFPGDEHEVHYKEGIFVGYRHYDTRDVKPLFPFGYGLSYTTFEYSQLQVDQRRIKDHEMLNVSVSVKNTGPIAGKEIVQLYVRDTESTVIRPEKELKGFRKLFLLPGEAQTVTFQLDKRSFAYYNVQLKDWHVETGTFEILIAKSSREMVLRESIEVESTVPLPKIITRDSTFGDLMEHPAGAEVVKSMLAASAPSEEGDGTKMLGMNVNEVMKATHLRTAVAMSNGVFTEEALASILQAVNSAN